MFFVFSVCFSPMYLCMYVRTYVCMSVCVSVCLYVCLSVCMHACMHVCVCFSPSCIFLVFFLSFRLVDLHSFLPASRCFDFIILLMLIFLLLLLLVLFLFGQLFFWPWTTFSNLASCFLTLDYSCLTLPTLFWPGLLFFDLGLLFFDLGLLFLSKG